MSFYRMLWISRFSEEMAGAGTAGPECPQGCPTAAASVSPPFQPGPSKGPPAWCHSGQQKEQSWGQKQEKGLVFEQRGAVIPSSLNGKTKKLTRKAPSSSFSIFLLPSQHGSSKGLLWYLLSLPHPQVQWDFHGPFPLGPLGQGRHVLQSAYSSPSALESRSGPPLERRPSLSFGPPPPLVSLLPALSLTSTPIHPFSDMIWLLGTLVSHEAPSSVQAGMIWAIFFSVLSFQTCLALEMGVLNRECGNGPLFVQRPAGHGTVYD